MNPNVDPQTHPYISTGLKENKFGVPIKDSYPLFNLAHESEHLIIKGIDCHIGSQIGSVEPLAEAVRSLCKTVDQLEENGILIGGSDSRKDGNAIGY